MRQGARRGEENDGKAARIEGLDASLLPAPRGASIESKNQYSGALGHGRPAALHAQMPHSHSPTACRPLPCGLTCLLQALLSLCLSAAALTARADDIADARALIARGQLEAALQSANRAVAANPRNAQARFLLGVVLMDLAKDAQAIVAFTELTQQYPELPDPYNNLALLHARQGRLELARQSLDNALRNDPHHRAARANLGHVHLMLAVQAWEHLAALGPVDVPLQRKLESARALLVWPALTGPAAATAPPAR
jgi:tetratricopeptide (TPR) repeat protein